MTIAWSGVERPILFSGAMVRKIIEDLKTNTRRVAHLADNVRVVDGVAQGYLPGCPEGFVIPCPYGKPGDRLWVRETWASPETNLKLPGRVAYNADGEAGAFMGDGGGGYFWLHHGRILEAEGYQQCFPKNGSNTYGLKKFGGRWRPSIHMPRWASRLTLEIVSVKVERVQDVSLEDCLAEGIDVPGRDRMLQIGPIKRECDEAHCRAHFHKLWDSINSKRDGGKHAWVKNPWVWAIEFKRVEAHVS